MPRPPAPDAAAPVGFAVAAPLDPVAPPVALLEVVVAPLSAVPPVATWAPAAPVLPEAPEPPEVALLATETAPDPPVSPV